MKQWLMVCLLSLTGWANAEQQGGQWEAGLLLLGAETRFEGQKASWYPMVQTNNNKWFVVPNISYGQDRWRIGLAGASYQWGQTGQLQHKVSLAYPFSGYEVSGQEGWFRYKGVAGLVIDQGLSAKYQLNLTGLDVALFHGFGEEVSALKSSLGFGAPLLLKPSWGVTMIAQAGVAFENQQWAQSRYGLTPDATWLRHPELQLVAILKPRSDLTWLITANHRWLDTRLTREAGLKERASLSVFSMLSLRF